MLVTTMNDFSFSVIKRNASYQIQYTSFDQKTHEIHKFIIHYLEVLVNITEYYNLQTACQYSSLTLVIFTKFQQNHFTRNCKSSHIKNTAIHATLSCTLTTFTKRRSVFCDEI
jgi:hypothetical protein